MVMPKDVGEAGEGGEEIILLLPHAKPHRGGGQAQGSLT